MEVRGLERSRTGTAFLVLLAASAFVATAALLRDRLPGGTQHERTEIKFAHFRAHRDEFTLAFFGSSRVFRGFDPELFDRVCAEQGVRTRSYNFGIPGSHAIEIQHLLARLQGVAPERLDFALIDPEGLNVPAIHRNFQARAVVDWHDLEMTRLISRYVLDGPYDAPTKREYLFGHWGSCAYNFANVGRSLGWVDAWLGIVPSDAFVAETIGPEGNGYWADFVNPDQPTRREERFQRKGQQDYLARLEELRAKKPSGEPASQVSLTLFQRMSRLVRELGAEPVFVTLPALYLQDDLLSAHAAGQVEHLLCFHDPNLHPELYEVDHREDQTHLNAAGARLFTEKLAREFAQLAKQIESQQ